MRNTLDVLRDEIRAGTPVVGMEPTCLAVFKDELGKMLPHDDDAQRLAANAYHWSEFFQQFDVPVLRLDREVLLWGHCHHKATGGIDPEQQLLERMRAQVRMVSGGCRGLAGSWGFEAGKQEISMACGEQALLPAVRAAAEQTVVVANGFSCKTQIEQAGTGRRALHVAQLMTMAREHGSRGHTATFPRSPNPSTVPPRPHPCASPARRPSRPVPRRSARSAPRRPGAVVESPRRPPRPVLGGVRFAVSAGGRRLPVRAARPRFPRTPRQRSRGDAVERSQAPAACPYGRVRASR